MGEEKIALLRDPRLSLAAEQTFLSWIRTGLAFMGFGFVLARFGLFLREWALTQNVVLPMTHGLSLWLGISLILVGVILSFAAWIRYLMYIRGLARGKLPSIKRRLETATALGLVAIGIAAVASLLALTYFSAPESLLLNDDDAPPDTPQEEAVLW